MNDNSTHEQNIQRVAWLIYELEDQERGPGSMAGSIQQLNKDLGWTFEIRYRPAAERYASTRDYTRVEGLRLSDEDLERAMQLAKEIDKGRNENEV